MPAGGEDWDKVMSEGKEVWRERSTGDGGWEGGEATAGRILQNCG